MIEVTNNRTKWLGWICLAGFVGCIWLANFSITHWGEVPFPGGPHTVTIGPWTAPSGVLFVGLSLGLRDGAQQALGKWRILGAIVIGAGLSYLVAPSLAWASGLGFLIGEGGDWLIFTPLIERGKVTAAIVASNTVGSALDTTVFLWVAFNSLDFFWGQFWLKTLMILPALLVVVPIRWRRRVVSRHVA